MYECWINLFYCCCWITLCFVPDWMMLLLTILLRDYSVIIGRTFISKYYERRDFRSMANLDSLLSLLQTHHTTVTFQPILRCCIPSLDQKNRNFSAKETSPTSICLTLTFLNYFHPTQWFQELIISNKQTESNNS